MVKKTITLELFDLKTENSELSLKEKLLNQVKEDEETIEKVNKNNITFAKGVMPLFFNYIKILSEQIDPDLNKKKIYFKFKNGELIVDLFTIKFQRRPTHFSRWMNLVNNFINIFGYLKYLSYICRSKLWKKN